MRIVEALVLAASQVQDQLLLGKRQGPRHGASAIAVLDPAEGIGPIAAFEALYWRSLSCSRREASRTLNRIKEHFEFAR